MSDIFQEVDEEVRRDKALEFWKKHQNLIIAGAALIVLATGGYRFYENRKIAAEEAAGAAVQGKTDPAGALAVYDALAADRSIGPLFQDAAKLRAALLRLDQGDVTATKPVFEALATPTGAYRFTARLALGVIAIDASNFTEAGQQLDLIVADPEAPAAEKRSAESLFGLVAANRPAK
jgi:hypothetical protein